LILRNEAVSHSALEKQVRVFDVVNFHPLGESDHTLNTILSQVDRYKYKLPRSLINLGYFMGENKRKSLSSSALFLLAIGLVPVAAPAASSKTLSIEDAGHRRDTLSGNAASEANRSNGYINIQCRT
jgi:hypothetical protein